MKFQIPSSKLLRTSKSHARNNRRAMAALEVEAWSFSGAWMLVLGAF